MHLFYSLCTICIIKVETCNNYNINQYNCATLSCALCTAALGGVMGCGGRTRRSLLKRAFVRRRLILPFRLIGMHIQGIFQ
jgi:hypothetical protein